MRFENALLPPIAHLEKKSSRAPDPSSPSTLAFKPDFAEAVQRWQAYFCGDIIDRPVVCVTAPQGDEPPTPASSYRDRAFGDMDELIAGMIRSAERTFYGGEAIPTAWLSFGPDEIACFCGAELEWSDHSGNTNWSRPIVNDWDQALPLTVQESNPLWQRMLAFYRHAAERLAGKMHLSSLDLHTNMDLLAGLRGPQQLCIDLLDSPDALVHTDDLIASQGLHTFSYVPGHGRGTHLDYLDLYQRVQRGGKAVHFSGTPQELKEAHRVLEPNKVLYTSSTATQAEAEELLDWFVKNT